MIAIAGGTASVLGGGKFANGAMSAAFVFMFNELAYGGDGKNNLVLLKKKADRYLYNQIAKMKFKNIFVLGGHGGSGSFDYSKFISFRALINLIGKSGKAEILLVACDQGNYYGIHFPQILANATGLPVQYSENLVQSIGSVPYSIPFYGGMHRVSPWKYANPE